MTNDHKPPMFGASGVFDPATYEPRSGKTFWKTAADALIGNCTTRITFKYESDPKDNGHTFILSTTRQGQSGMVARHTLLQTQKQPNPDSPFIDKLAFKE